MTPARSPALQATAPTRMIIKITADMREGELDIVNLITNSFERLGTL